MLKSLFCLACAVLPLQLHAQVVFQRTYGGPDDDNAYAAQQTADGGYVIAGGTMSFGGGGSDACLVKTDALGDTQWTRTFGGAGYEGANWAEQTSDGGYILAGEVADSSYQDIYLVRTDTSGNVLWSKTFGVGPGEMEFVGQVRQTADGGFIIAGTVGDAPYSDVLLVKTDSGGNTIWTRAFGGPDDGDMGYAVEQTTDGGYVVAGATASFGAGWVDAYLIKLDSTGNIMWTNTFGDSAVQRLYSVAQTADGGYVVAGYTGGYGVPDDIYVVRTDAAGNAIWIRTMGGPGLDVAVSVAETPDSGYVIAGHTLSFGAGNFDAYLVRTNRNGDTLWTRTFGGPDEDLACSVQPTTDGGYVIGGSTRSSGAGGSDLWLIKTDSLGGTAVEEPRQPQTTSPKLQAEPNPCRGKTAISFQLTANSSAQLSLFDPAGRLVLSRPIRTSPFILHPSSLPAGVYLVRLDCGSQHASTRLILQR